MTMQTGRVVWGSKGSRQSRLASAGAMQVRAAPCRARLARLRSLRSAAVLLVATASSGALAQETPPYVNADGTGTYDLQAAMQSWRDDPEFQGNWGLKAMNADGAYALGITGNGVRIGVFDSGILSSHQEFVGGRLNLIYVEGFSTEGKPFGMSGEYNPEINDDHGTGMTGLIVASRDNKKCTASLSVRPSMLPIRAGVTIYSRAPTIRPSTSTSSNRRSMRSAKKCKSGQ